MTHSWLPALRSTCFRTIPKIAVFTFFGALFLIPASLAQHGGGSSGGSSGGGSGGGTYGGSHGGGFSGSHNSTSAGASGNSSAHNGGVNHGSGSSNDSDTNRTRTSGSTSTPSPTHSFWHALAFWHHPAPSPPPSDPVVVSGAQPSLVVSSIVENLESSGLLPARIAYSQSSFDTRKELSFFSKQEFRRFSGQLDPEHIDRHHPPFCRFHQEFCSRSFYRPYASVFSGSWDCDHSFETLFPGVPLPEPYPGAPYHIEYYPCQRPVLRYDIPPGKNRISAKTGTTDELPDFNVTRLGW
jgi:hypothetical protein